MSLFQIITLLTLVVSLNLKLNPETKEEKVLYPTGEGGKEVAKKPQKKLDLSEARPKKFKKPRKVYTQIERIDRRISEPELFAEEEREEQEELRNIFAIFISMVAYSAFLLYLKVGADAKRRIIP